MNARGITNRVRRAGSGVDTFSVVAIIIAALFVIGIAVYAVWNFTPYSAHGCVVNDKDRSHIVENKSSRVDYKIYTDNCGVLSVNDSLLGLQFNAADEYNNIKVGETYDFSGRGFRVPIISMFPNIEEAHLVK